MRDYLTRHSLAELRAFFARSRLRPHALNAFYPYPQFLGPNDDPARRRALLDEMLLGLITAREIGAHDAIVVAPLLMEPGSGPYPGTWDETFRECVRILRRLSDFFRFYDVRICFEPVGYDRCAVRTADQAAQIVEEVDRDNVGYVVDAYNFFVYDQKNDFSSIRTLDPKKIFAAHIMNADAAPVAELSREKRRFCDSGALDLANFLANLKAVGYDGMVSIETFRPEYWRRDPEWVVREACRTTRDILKANGALGDS